MTSPPFSVRFVGIWLLLCAKRWRNRVSLEETHFFLPKLPRRRLALRRCRARTIDPLQQLLSGLENQQPMPSGPALLEALRMCWIGG